MLANIRCKQTYVCIYKSVYVFYRVSMIGHKMAHIQGAWVFQSVKCPTRDLSSSLDLRVVNSIPALGSTWRGAYFEKNKGIRYFPHSHLRITKVTHFFLFGGYLNAFLLFTYFSVGCHLFLTGPWALFYNKGMNCHLPAESLLCSSLSRSPFNFR